MEDYKKYTDKQLIERYEELVDIYVEKGEVDKFREKNSDIMKKFLRRRLKYRMIF